MGRMEDYSIDQLAFFVVGVMGALGALCLSIQKSKCKKIKLCCGIVDCDRDVKAILEEEKIQKGLKLTPKPRIAEANDIAKKELRLELKEPEPEETEEEKLFISPKN